MEENDDEEKKRDTNKTLKGDNFSHFFSIHCLMKNVNTISDCMVRNRVFSR